MFEYKDNREEHNEALCQVCECDTGESDFEDIDDEFNPDAPMCPDCQAAKRLRNQHCEYCDEPAEHETDSGFLCSEHHSQYVDGYVNRD